MTRQSPPGNARAWVEIDLDALVRNAGRLRERSAVPLLPMVKADAYGLGAVPVARALDRTKPFGFGVATIEEGRELRDAGITRPILVFTPLLTNDMAAAATLSLTPTFGDSVSINEWRARGGAAWHLAIETGMNRAGVPWTDVVSLATAVRQLPPAGAFTHFHSANLAGGTMAEQERRFELALKELPARPPLLHCENSAALERRTRSRWNFARPGVFLYGVSSGPGAEIAPEQVVHVRARVVDLFTVADGETVSYEGTYRAAGERRIATLGIGYADGYCRALSNRGVVLLNGARVPVAGIVTMDMTMVDVTGVPCTIGDVATVIGTSQGSTISVNEVAQAAQMSPYEVLTGLRGRIARHYLHAA